MSEREPSGKDAVLGAFFSLKMLLFLSAANIHRAYGSKSVNEVGGALKRLPATGVLFLAGFFAITGSPPFGPFFSELTILRDRAREMQRHRADRKYGGIRARARRYACD